MDSFEVEEKKKIMWKKKTKKKKNFVSESIFEHNFGIKYLPRSRKQSIQKFLIHKKIWKNSTVYQTKHLQKYVQWLQQLQNSFHITYRNYIWFGLI